MDIYAIKKTLGNPDIDNIKEKDGLALIGVSLETAYISVVTDGKMAEVAIEYGDRLAPIGGGFQTLEYEMTVSEPMRLEAVGALIERLRDEDLDYPNPLPLWVPRGGKGHMASVFGITGAFGYETDNSPHDDSLPF